MSMYPSSLTTVEAVIRQLSKADPGATISPALSQYQDFYRYMVDLIPQVSAYIEGECDRSFVPYKEDKTLYFADLTGGMYDARRRFLWLPDDLLVLNSTAWDGTTLAVTDYRLESTDGGSAWAVRFNPSAALAWSSDFNDGIVISGVWGAHDNLSRMWTTVDASVPIADTTTTTVTVAASSAYEVLQYIRNESEYMQITNKPSATTLTVLRGVNGTTAAAHTAQPLQTFMPVQDIRMAATRLAAFFYEKRTDVGGVVTVGDASFRLDSMPPAVKETINRRRRLTFGTV